MVLIKLSSLSWSWLLFTLWAWRRHSIRYSSQVQQRRRGKRTLFSLQQPFRCVERQTDRQKEIQISQSKNEFERDDAFSCCCIGCWAVYSSPFRWMDVWCDNCGPLYPQQLSTSWIILTSVQMVPVPSFLLLLETLRVHKQQRRHARDGILLSQVLISK